MPSDPESDEAAHTYAGPTRTASAQLPAPLVHYLDGTDLLTKTQALRLSTVDEEGWPHAALLSAGDALALPSGTLRFVLFPQSTTTKNLERDRRVTVTLSVDGAMCELRMRCRRLDHSATEVPLALFEATLVETRVHEAPYAAVSGGVTFALHEPDAVLPRWQRQIELLRDGVSP